MPTIIYCISSVLLFALNTTVHTNEVCEDKNTQWTEDTSMKGGRGKDIVEGREVHEPAILTVQLLNPLRKEEREGRVKDENSRRLIELFDFRNGCCS